jgi:hypothetical protein
MDQSGSFLFVASATHHDKKNIDQREEEKPDKRLDAFFPIEEQ